MPHRQRLFLFGIHPQRLRGWAILLPRLRRWLCNKSKRALPLEMPARDGAKPRQERVRTGNTRAIVWFIPAVVPCRRIRMRNLFREAYENAMLKRAVHFGVRARETSVLGCGHADISTV